MVVDREGLSSLDIDGRCFVGGLESLHIGKQCVGIEVVCFNVNVLAEERADGPNAAVYSSFVSL